MSTAGLDLRVTLDDMAELAASYQFEPYKAKNEELTELRIKLRKDEQEFFPDIFQALNWRQQIAEHFPAFHMMFEDFQTMLRKEQSILRNFMNFKAEEIGFSITYYLDSNQYNSNTYYYSHDHDILQFSTHRDPNTRNVVVKKDQMAIKFNWWFFRNNNDGQQVNLYNIVYLPVPPTYVQIQQRLKEINEEYDTIPLFSDLKDEARQRLMKEIINQHDMGRLFMPIIDTITEQSEDIKE